MAPSLEGANQYHGSRLGKEAWEAESSERRERAVLQASEDLTAFSSLPGYETAVYEQALWLLGDEAELAINGVTSIGLDGMSKGYARGKCPAHICPKAWALATGTAGGPVKAGRLRSGDPWLCLIRS